MRYNSNLFVLLETHVSGTRAQRLIAKFGFDGNYVVNGDGFSRGISVLWKKSNWCINISREHKQFVHMIYD